MDTVKPKIFQEDYYYGLKHLKGSERKTIFNELVDIGVLQMRTIGKAKEYALI